MTIPLIVYSSGVVIAWIIGYRDIRKLARTNPTEAKDTLGFLFWFSFLSWIAVAIDVALMIDMFLKADLEAQHDPRKKKEEYTSYFDDSYTEP